MPVVCNVSVEVAVVMVALCISTKPVTLAVAFSKFMGVVIVSRGRSKGGVPDNVRRLSSNRSQVGALLKSAEIRPSPVNAVSFTVYEKSSPGVMWIVAILPREVPRRGSACKDIVVFATSS
jgi:hypothetical protein